MADGRIFREKETDKKICIASANEIYVPPFCTFLHSLYFLNFTAEKHTQKILMLDPEHQAFPCLMLL